MRPIIRAEGLGKQYRIGARRDSGRTLRDAFAELARDPLKGLRRNGRDEELWALRDVNFEVAQGELVGLIGRNGAGKSTLLKLLSRVTEPTAGRIELYGRIGSLLEVGTGFHPELTGRENVFLNGAIMGMSRAEIARKFDEIVAFSGVEKFLDTPVKRYSSGMYTRLAFAVAAHLEPEILVVDEVLAVGDAQFQKKCLGKMNDVAKSGRTVLFVSHSMEAIRKLCTRGVLLEGGRVSFNGPVEAAIKRYVEGGVEARSAYAIAPPAEGDAAPGYAYELVIEDGDGKPATSVPVGSPWQIRVRFRVERRVEHFIVALGFVTGMNVPLRTSWGAPRDIEPGEYEAVFREEQVVLGPGRYNVIVSLSSFERPFQYVEEAAALDIADFSEGIDLIKVSGVGLILNPLKVDVNKLA